MQGATGDTGVVPESGSHVVKEGYQAERLSASLNSSLVNVKLVPLTYSPPLFKGSAPADISPNSSLRFSRTSESNPAVLGVAKEVPEVV